MRKRVRSPAASGWLRCRSMRWSWVAGMRRRMSSEGGGAVVELGVPGEDGI
jgi:hypothetical protein